MSVSGPRLSPVWRALQQGAHFQCADGRRISTAFVDDGIRDCKDGEDEQSAAKDPVRS